MPKVLIEALADAPRTPSPELEGWIRQDAIRLA
jgi:acetolactate synthase I/II/III large subunit